METTPTPVRYVLYRTFLLCILTTIFASTDAFSQSSTCIQDAVANGNNDPWSEECYLNDDCQEQGNPCTANDVRLLGVFIADAMGNPVPACNIGDNETVLLWGTFSNNTGTDRYAIRARTEVWINGAFITELNACSFDVLPSGASDVALIGSFNYTCGSQIQLLNTWVGWDTSASQCGDPMGANYSGDCGDYASSKCSKDLGFINFLTPNFGYDCGVTTPGTTEVCFEDLTIGGTEPYMYDWDFGDGGSSALENPCHVYNATSGIFVVTLNITDADGVMAGAFLEIDLANLVCCELTIICPPMDAGQYDCIEEVPLPDISLVSVVESCGPVTISVSADTLGSGCGTAQIVSRLYQVTDGLNNTACMQIFTVLDETAPVITCPADITIECDESTLPDNTGMASATDACNAVDTIFYIDYEGDAPLESPQFRWVYLPAGAVGDSCTSLSSCETEQLCFGLQYIPGYTGILTSYTTGFFINCVNDLNPILYNASCVMRDNSEEDVVCMGPEGILMNSSGNSGTLPVFQNEPVILHQVCFQMTSGIPITLEEDNITDLTTSLDLPNGQQATELPDFITFQAALEDYCSTGCAYPKIIQRRFIAQDDCGNQSACNQQITIKDLTPPVVTCPANMTISCNTDTTPATTGTATATDNCGAVSAVTFNDVTVAGSCIQEYTITRTWQSTDECGNVGTCAQTIVVDDAAPPMITCPMGITVQCASQVPAPNTSLVTATDNCTGTPTITVLPDVTTSQTCINRYTITRTYVATDACGNSASCTQAITVFDNTPPTITCPMNVTVNCIGNVPPVNINTVMTSDNCGGTVTVVSLGDQITNAVCTNRLTLTRTYRATDACGNSATCAQIITVNDQTPPSITCPANITVSCAANVPAPNVASVTRSDNCGGSPTVIHVGDVITNQTCANRYTVTRTYRATDVCGNSATCAQTITVNDQTPPTITCPAALTVSCASQVPAVDIATVVSSDNCSGAVTITHVGDVISNQTCANRYTLTRTYRATDVCGNSATCSQVIVVNDVTAPLITCPDDIEVSCASDIPDPDINSVTTSDFCNGVVTVVFVNDIVTNPNCANQYLVTRTYRATDECGNSATCEQIISINNQTPPTIVCPDDITVDCVADVPVPDPGSVSTTDNCGAMLTVTFVSDVTVSQTCLNQYVINRTYSAADDCGNTMSCVQVITVSDDQAPAMTCPIAITVTCAENIPDVDIASVSATDNCIGTVSISHIGDEIFNESCDHRFTVVRTYGATDACGNSNTCTQIITVFDDIAPVITCPDDITVDCALGVPMPDPNSPTATDNCSGTPTVTFVSDVTIDEGCDNRYTINRTYMASDDCGNTGTCVQIIVVADEIIPSITCPALVTVQCASEVPAPDINSVTASDNCANAPTVTFVQDITVNQTCVNRYTLERVYMATDACGNSATCSQAIQVFDNTPPVITCPQDVSVSCHMLLPLPNPASVVATDNCGGIPTVTHLSDVTVNQTCASRYTLNRTYMAVDACGNSSTCLQVITINDTTPPDFSCPPNVTVMCTATVPQPSISTTIVNENCAGMVMVRHVSDVISNQTCANRYLITRTYSATDVCGNSSTCTQLITVDDQTPPTITCPVDQTVSCTSLVPPVDLNAPVSQDNCSGVTIQHDGDEISNQTCGNRYTITRTYRAVDDCGNTATCTQSITVFDDIAPEIACADDITIEAGESISPDNTGSASATDNCGEEVELTFRDVTIEGACDGEYSIDRTWTATDICGNTSECTQRIFISLGCFLDLSLRKELAIGQPMIINAGDNVLFTITVENEGNVAVSAVEITDYIPIGFSLNDSDWLAGTEGSTGQSASITLSVGNGALPPLGLLPGETVSVDITLRSSPSLTGGQYVNIAEISFVLGSDGEDITDLDDDSQPDTDDANDPADEDDHDPAVICINSAPVIDGNRTVCENATATYLVANYNPEHIYTWMVSEGGFIAETTDSSITILFYGDLGTTVTITLLEDAGGDCQFSSETVVSIGDTGAIACIDHINLSIDNDCGTVVLPSLILVGDHLNNENYVVYVITMNGDTLPNATVTWEHVGQTFKVSVRSLCSGQSCWGMMTVEDKLPPILDCGCDTAETAGRCRVSCLLADDFIAGNIPEEYQPTVVDNCGGTTLELTDIQVSYETCDTGYVVIQWLATDAMGNTSTCEQLIEIVPLTLDSLTFPEDYTGNCFESGHPDETGWPHLDGYELSPANPSCNIMTRYVDQQIPLCGDGIKIIRRWTVTNWCNSQSITRMQQIFLKDQVGPELTCQANITISTDVWNCYSTVTLNRPQAVDACSDIINYQLFVAGGGTVVPAGNQFIIQQLPVGTHVATWRVTDECYNQSSCTFEITVVDLVPPVVVCHGHTVVSLTSDRPNGVTLVNAASLSDQSYDNCSALIYRARRMDSCIDFDWTTEGACIDDIPGGVPAVNDADMGTSFGTCFPVACCDIGNTIMVMLEVSDASGNVNTCMVEVEVQDKLNPNLTCPPEIVVSCEYLVDIAEGVYRDADGNNDGSLDEDPLSAVFGNMFDGFRHPSGARQPVIINDPTNPTFVQPHQWGLDGYAVDNCQQDLSVVVSVTEDCSGANLPVDAPDGAIKLIERRFTGFDGQQSGSCVQRIWVVDYNRFYISDTAPGNADPNDGVIWPDDVEINSCPDDLGFTGEPILFEDHCSLVAMTHSDRRFDFVDGVCFKILRDWKVIDWCQFNPNTGEGLWIYTQTIKVADAEPAEFLDCPAEPLALCTDDPEVSLPVNNQIFLGESNPNASSCSAHVRLTQTVREMCSMSVLYDVKIYPFNGNDFIQIKPETELVLDDNHEGVLYFDTKESLIGSISLNGLPYTDPRCDSHHRVLWTVEDGCGNRTYCDYLMRLTDCKDPSPVCIDGLSSSTMPAEGEVTIWAADFNASSFDDCTDSDDLIFSFSGSSYQPSFTFTCENVPTLGVPFDVSIWAADEGYDINCDGTIDWSERNKDFCTASMLITDNNDVCDEEGAILTGEIMTELTEAVSDAMVYLQGPNMQFPGFMTQDEGQYIFASVPLGLDYTLHAERNDNPKNGVSTLDLVHIQKHLLGLQPFTSGYQYVAADANNSMSISAVDLLEIRKLILGITPAFTQNTSWRFVRKEESGLNIPPWPLTESISVNDLQDAQGQSFDFTGIKIGDVNNSAVAHASQILPRNARPVQPVKVAMKGEIEAGKWIECKFIMPKGVEGFQWTLELQGLEYAGISSQVIPMDDSHVGVLNDDLITMSWNGAAFAGMEDGDISFVLKFNVKEKGLLQNMIRITGQVTPQELYDESAIIYNPVLEFEAGQVFSEFALYQNKPNPWNGYTLIEFDLPADADAKLTLYDVAGKVVKEFSGSFKAGRNMIPVQSSDIPAPGVVYYRLDSGAYTATKKMMVIR